MQRCCSLISKFVDISKRYSSRRSAPSARGMRVVSVPGTTEVCETSHYRTISAVASGHRWRPALSVQRCADADRSASARGRGRNLAFSCGRRRGHLLLTVRSQHMNWTHLQVAPIIRRVHWPRASASQLDWLKHNGDGWWSVTAERMYCNVAALHWGSRTGVQFSSFAVNKQWVISLTQWRSSTLIHFQFLPRDAVLARCTLSKCVRLSVRPSYPTLCYKEIFVARKLRYFPLGLRPKLRTLNQVDVWSED